MNNDRIMSDTEEQQFNEAALDRLMADALMDQVLLPEVSDRAPADLQQAAAALTPEDRQALAELGSPEEFVRQCRLAAQEADPPSARLVGDGSSLQGDSDETVPAFVPEIDANLPDKEELTIRLNAVEEAPRMTWTSSFRKLRELGRGGQGIVYLIECIDELSRTTQALKVYSPGPYPSAAAYRQDMQRILEISAIVHQIHHDNLIDVQRFFEYQGVYVMLMQLIDGFDLRRLLNTGVVEQLRKTIPANRWEHLDTVIYASPAENRVGLQPLLAVNIVEKCLRGLSVLHDKGIVHGDIKPSNIMLDSNGSIRLVDIGSAYAYEKPPRQRIWTPRYAPPEFLDGRDWTPQSDLASLGYVLLEMLCGSADFGGPSLSDASTTRHDSERDSVLLEAKCCLPQRLPDLLPAKVRPCERLLRLCQKLVDPDPEKRFASAEDAINGNSNGTWHFRAEMVRGDLAVYEASEIQHWVEDIKSIRR